MIWESKVNKDEKCIVEQDKSVEENQVLIYRDIVRVIVDSLNTCTEAKEKDFALQSCILRCIEGYIISNNVPNMVENCRSKCFSEAAN